MKSNHFQYLPWISWDVILEGRDWPAGLLLIKDDDVVVDDDDGEGEFFKVLSFL
jgi:hypothetical protein